jgi:hypothetical protein
MTTFRTDEIEREYDAVLDVLDQGAFWKKRWAAELYIGRVLTAMSMDVSPTPTAARRNAVSRVMLVLLEHLHNLSPATDEDLQAPRDRVETLTIPCVGDKCERWIDLLELMQLRNWTKKGLLSDASREAALEKSVSEQFSPELLREIQEVKGEFWLL